MVRAPQILRPLSYTILLSDSPNQMPLVWSAVFSKESAEESKVIHKRNFTPWVWWDTLILSKESFSLEPSLSPVSPQRAHLQMVMKVFLPITLYPLILVWSLYEWKDTLIMCSPFHPFPSLFHYLNKGPCSHCPRPPWLSSLRIWVAFKFRRAFIFKRARSKSPGDYRSIILESPSLTTLPSNSTKLQWGPKLINDPYLHSAALFIIEIPAIIRHRCVHVYAYPIRKSSCKGQLFHPTQADLGTGEWSLPSIL